MTRQLRQWQHEDEEMALKEGGEEQQKDRVPQKYAVLHMRNGVLVSNICTDDT